MANGEMMKFVFKAMLNTYAFMFGLVGGIEALRRQTLKPYGVAIILFFLGGIALINLIFVVYESNKEKK